MNQLTQPHQRREVRANPRPAAEKLINLPKFARNVREQWSATIPADVRGRWVQLTDSAVVVAYCVASTVGARSCSTPTSA